MVCQELGVFGKNGYSVWIALRLSCHTNRVEFGRIRAKPLNRHKLCKYNKLMPQHASSEVQSSLCAEISRCCDEKEQNPQPYSQGSLAAYLWILCPPR